LRYQVGRACAIAGYTSLYKELDLLPDVTIAEEARASSNGEEIFKDIMSRPVRYAAMDDYKRMIRNVPLPDAVLNDDTALVSTLSWRTAPSKTFRSGHRTEHIYFDITEDGGIGPVDEGEPRSDEFTLSDRWLLYSPLPRDLPPVNKDLLILMAAHQGNVDRYARLRRPVPIPHEGICVTRGIYHSTPFAKWCSIEAQKTCDSLGHGNYEASDLKAAHARFIMMNDLSRHTPDISAYDLPYLIWWPVKPWEITLRALLKREPRMRHQIAHAAIACNYQALYDELKVEPTEALLREAGYAWNDHYKTDLEARRHEMRVPPNFQHEPLDAWETAAPDWLKEPTTDILFGTVSPYVIETGQPGGLYQGAQPDVSTINVFMCVSEDQVREAEASEDRVISTISDW